MLHFTAAMNTFDNSYGPPFSTLCRTCLRPKDGMKPLYESSLIDMLMYCSSIKVVHGDGMPSNICIQCLRQVHRSCSFKKLCEKSEATLRRYVLYGCLPSEDVLRSDDTSQINIVDECVDTPEDKSILELSPLVTLTVHESGLLDLQDYAALSGCISDDDDGSGYMECPELGLEPECNLIENALAAMKDDVIRTDLPIESESLWLQQTDSFTLAKHANIDTVINSYPEVLNTEPSDNGYLQTLVTIVNTNKPFACQECKETFLTSEELNLHMSVHAYTSDENFQCNACNKIFSEKTKLKRHLKTHMTWKSHKCQYCNKDFSQQSGLNKHIKRHTTWKEKRFVCFSCGKAYPEARLLVTHIRKHTGEKPYPCTECGKSFSDSRLLSSHMKTHKQEKLHQCIICARRFTHSSTLTSHLRTHSGEKPYVCKICGKDFMQSSNLSLHMRTHTGEKPYTCKVCNRSFASSSTLSYHSRLHTGIKAYKCTLCSKAFARAEDVTLHMRIHTGERPFECPLCDKRFTTSSHKKQHLETHTLKHIKDCKVCGKDCTIRSHAKINSNLKANENATSNFIDLVNNF